MPEETVQTQSRPSPRSGRWAVAYWLVAGAVYAALGVLSPPAFLLGFWESLLFVFLATVLAPRVLGHRRTG